MANEDLRYTESHEWARQEGDVVSVGLSDYAVEQLGDIVFLELPSVGDEVSTDTSSRHHQTIDISRNQRSQRYIIGFGFGICPDDRFFVVGLTTVGVNIDTESYTGHGIVISRSANQIIAGQLISAEYSPPVAHPDLLRRCCNL